MASYSNEIEKLFGQGWTISNDGFSLVKEERRSISETRPVRVSRFGNRQIKIYDSTGKSPRTVRGRRKLSGHQDYPNTIFGYDKRGNPITVLKGKVVALRAIFGGILDKATHIYIQGQLIPIVRIEDRVEITNLDGVSEGGFVNVEVYYYKILAKEKPLYLEFIYVYTFNSTTIKSHGVQRILECHWETTIKYSEWDSFKRKTGELDYGRISNVIEGYADSKEYHFMYVYDNEADEIEGVTEVKIKLKPKTFRSDAHIYDGDTGSNIRRNINTLPENWWGYEDSDIISLIGG